MLNRLYDLVRYEGSRIIDVSADISVDCLTTLVEYCLRVGRVSTKMLATLGRYG